MTNTILHFPHCSVHGWRQAEVGKSILPTTSAEYEQKIVQQQKIFIHSHLYKSISVQFLADDQCEGMVAATPGAELHGCWWRGGAVLHWYSLYSSWRTPSEVQGRKAEPCTDLSSAVSNWGQPKHWGAPASWSWTMIEQVRCEVFSGHPSQCFYHAKNLQITCLLQ